MAAPVSAATSAIYFSMSEEDIEHAMKQPWVSVGIDHDTASFAVNSIRRWWQTMGQQRYPQARQLMISADGGGSTMSTNASSGL